MGSLTRKEAHVGLKRKGIKQIVFWGSAKEKKRRKGIPHSSDLCG